MYGKQPSPGHSLAGAHVREPDIGARPAQPYVLVTRGFWGLPRTRPPMARTVKSQVTPRLPSSRTSAPIYTRGRPDVNRGPNSRTPPPPAALPECTGCTGTRPDLRVHHAHVHGPCTG